MPDVLSHSQNRINIGLGLEAKGFDESENRDDHGRFSSGGSSGKQTGGGVPKGEGASDKGKRDLAESAAGIVKKAQADHDRIKADHAEASANYDAADKKLNAGWDKVAGAQKEHDAAPTEATARKLQAAKDESRQNNQAFNLAGQEKQYHETVLSHAKSRLATAHQMHEGLVAQAYPAKDAGQNTLSSSPKGDNAAPHDEDGYMKQRTPVTDEGSAGRGIMEAETHHANAKRQLADATDRHEEAKTALDAASEKHRKLSSAYAASVARKESAATQAIHCNHATNARYSYENAQHNHAMALNHLKQAAGYHAETTAELAQAHAAKANMDRYTPAENQKKGFSLEPADYNPAHFHVAHNGHPLTVSMEGSGARDTLKAHKDANAGAPSHEVARKIADDRRVGLHSNNIHPDAFKPA